MVSDGLVHQESNPEVPVDISRPDVDINEQIFALKLMTKKLENAFNGQKVEWPVSQGEEIMHIVLTSQFGKYLYMLIRIMLLKYLGKMTLSIFSLFTDRSTSAPEGSGGCNSGQYYSDDEDCDGSEYYEGSGSGGSEDADYYYEDYDDKTVEGNSDDDDDDDDDDVNWPPWMTSMLPNEDDIKIEDETAEHAKEREKQRIENTLNHHRPQKPPPVIAGASSNMVLARGLVYYLLPLFTSLLGGAITSSSTPSVSAR